MVAENPDTVLRALQSLARTGWMLRGVPAGEAETVAAHLFKSSVIALDLGYRLRDKGYQVDPIEAAIIALLHDMGESVIGDIPKTAGIGEAKKKAEHRAVENLPFHKSLRDFIIEFDEESEEALLARLAESLATLLQALDYEKRGYNVGEIRQSMELSIKSIMRKVGWERDVATIIKEVYGVNLFS